MIAAQKQLIENADTVQERIAQVQREGKVHRLMNSWVSWHGDKMVWMSTHEWNNSSTEILKNEGLWLEHQTAKLNEGISSVNKSVSKQH